MKRSMSLARAGIGARESLTREEFLQRASGDEGQKFRAVNQETILRNERGVRTFGTGPFDGFDDFLRLTITQQPDYEMYEYACHEGNGAVGYALSADRAFDRKVEEAKAKGLPIPQRDMSSPYGPPVEGLEVIEVR